MANLRSSLSQRMFRAWLQGWWRRMVRSFWRNGQWWVIGALWVATAYLGHRGVTKLLTSAGERCSAWDPLYRALQLFVMEDGALPVRPDIPWELGVARLLAPVMAASTALAALAAFFWGRLQSLRLRFYRDHVVICGLGQMGLQIVRDFCDREKGRKRVVVIERDGQNDAVRSCREDGVIVLVGDATDPDLLVHARADRARYLFGTCGADDGANVEVAVLVHREQQKRKRAGGVTCCVHLVDPGLRDLVRESQVYAAPGARLEVKFFDIFENSARALLERHPPEVHADPGSNAPVHALVIGFGQTGEGLTLRAARVGHYARGRKLRVTVIDQEAKRKEAALRFRYPQLDKACDVRFLQMAVEDAGFLSGEFLRDREAPISVIYVFLDSDARGLSCALSLLPNLKDSRIPIVVRMAQDAWLASLLQNVDLRRYPVHPFLMIEDACRREMILNEDQDRLARAIHEAYIDQQKALGRTPQTNPSMVPWEALPEGLKDSNRQQADHIPVKLRAVGCRAEKVEGTPAAFAFTPEEVEVLAAMEHARWNAERFLAGWTCGPERDPVRKISPYLVDWDQLPENIKKYDRDTVQSIPDYLARVGMEIRRV